MNKTKFMTIVFAVATVIMALLCVDAYFAAAQPNNLLVIMWRCFEVIGMVAYTLSAIIAAIAFLTGMFESLPD